MKNVSSYNLVMVMVILRHFCLVIQELTHPPAVPGKRV